ncbi:MAG: hypothetical protein WB799_22420 [Candidatus Sulfotelmatobacter sp.]
MKSQAPESRLNKSSSSWPISEMLLRGTYGTGTPAEKRLLSRTRIIFFAMLGWAFLGTGSHAHPNPVMRVITVFLPAVLCSYYAFEKRKYFLSLDELTRRIELEGMGILAGRARSALGGRHLLCTLFTLATRCEVGFVEAVFPFCHCFGNH